MAKQTVGRTALGAATCRLIEQYQPEQTRLFNDPIVKWLVGAPIRFLMQFAGMRNFTVKQTNNVMQGIFGAQICRTRYIDDMALAAMAQGINQVVILGAGLDTRAYRLPGMEDVKVFELDLQSVQKDKKKDLKAHLGALPEHVTFIPIDFETQSLNSAFAETSYDPLYPALFIWEGVTQYITEDAVRQTLSFVSKSARGSKLVFTYVLKSVIERSSEIPGVDKMMDFVANDSPFIFGFEPSSLSAYLSEFNLALIEDVGNMDYQARYINPLGRSLLVSEIERTALALVKAP